ncbi:hypothetical protein A9Q94_04995 [Rhodobacterales bacterium 56_14_T64]|nr:hypothetical protein A9Q94_04995 [Rhodobacterales bacterium 56_14_T64]
MTPFSTTEVNIVKNGTVIQDAISGEELVIVTENDAIFHRGAVYVTATNWDRMKSNWSSYPIQPPEWSLDP